MRIKKCLLSILMVWSLMFYVSETADATTIAQWLFDEGAGDTAYDTSGFGNDGTVNDALFVTDTPFNYGGNYALSLDGDGDYLIVPASDSLNSFTDAITIEAWVKADGNQIGNYDYAIAKYLTSGVASFALDALNDDRLRFYVKTENTTSFVQTIYEAPVDNPLWNNEWHHIAGIYNGSSIGIYVDGNLVSFAGVDGNLTINEDGDLYIGSYGTVIDYYFPGIMDEVRISDVALGSLDLGYHGTLAPIPEPATMILLGSGLIGLAGLRKKFKKYDRSSCPAD